MKLIFSRKGFDSSSGGCPSPIICGRPISLPIPTDHRSCTTYGDLDLGDIVDHATRGKLNGKSLCHFDPMFENGRCAFGQTDKAQKHLENNQVGDGDVFLFFGLFAYPNRVDPHHRIFGYLKVDEVLRVGSNPSLEDQPRGFSIQHPHTIGEWNSSNAIYVGSAGFANSDHPELRLSVSGENKSIWQVPSWVRETGLTYHRKSWRWRDDGTLQSVSRGQEFITDIGKRNDAKEWLENIVALMPVTKWELSDGPADYCQSSHAS